MKRNLTVCKWNERFSNVSTEVWLFCLRLLLLIHINWRFPLKRSGIFCVILEFIIILKRTKCPPARTRPLHSYLLIYLFTSIFNLSRFSITCIIYYLYVNTLHIIFDFQGVRRGSSPTTGQVAHYYKNLVGSSVMTHKLNFRCSKSWKSIPLLVTVAILLLNRQWNMFSNFTD